jgi:hypothetical protein
MEDAWAITAAAVALTALVHAATRAPRWRAAMPPCLLAALVGRFWLDLHPQWEWWLLPFPAYAVRQQALVYLLGAWFAVAAAVHLPVRWNRQLLRLGAAVALFAGHLALLPPPTTLGSDARPDTQHHLRQSTLTTCGPSACAMALAYFGVVVSERTAVEACRQRDRGVRLLQLAGGAASLAPWLQVTVQTELPAADAMVLGSTPGGGHAVCIAFVGEVALLHDPLQPAPQSLPRERALAKVIPPFVVLRSGALSGTTPAPYELGAARSLRR